MKSRMRYEFGEHLTFQKENILSRWETRVAEELPMTTTKESSMISRDVMEIIDEIGQII